MARGAFIVIEGTDGVGKGTQSELLVQRLKDEGYDVALYDFPRYGEASARLVEAYLNGELGPAKDNGPYVASSYYAIDRYHAGVSIRADIEAGKVVISNRYVGSNMGHQGQKIEDNGERSRYFDWVMNLEFEIFQIPRPDINIVLMLDPEFSQTLIDQKEKRSYTDKKRDLHEADLGHLQRAKKVYEEICSQFPESFVTIDCNDTEGIKSREAIHDLIWNRVGPLVKDR